MEVYVDIHYETYDLVTLTFDSFFILLFLSLSFVPLQETTLTLGQRGMQWSGAIMKATLRNTTLILQTRPYSGQSQMDGDSEVISCY